VTLVLILRSGYFFTAHECYSLKSQRAQRDFLISGERPEIKKFQACGASVLNGNGFVLPSAQRQNKKIFLLCVLRGFAVNDRF
jgi:hypothetical protein